MRTSALERRGYQAALVGRNIDRGAVRPDASRLDEAELAATLQQNARREQVVSGRGRIQHANLAPAR
jgi:hypothetical protein